MKNRRPVLNAFLCVVALSALLLSDSARACAQENPDYGAELKRAIQLLLEQIPADGQMAGLAASSVRARDLAVSGGLGAA